MRRIMVFVKCCWACVIILSLRSFSALASPVSYIVRDPQKVIRRPQDASILGRGSQWLDNTSTTMSRVLMALHLRIQYLQCNVSGPSCICLPRAQVVSRETVPAMLRASA